MPFIYFITIIIIVLFVLKKLIVRKKKSNVEIKPLPKDNLIKQTDKLENIPFYKYNENIRLTYKIFEPNLTIPSYTMFFIEYGEILIYHNDVFICKKSSNDFHFHTLDLYDKINIIIKTKKETKIAIFDHTIVHPFIINCCLKKKVFELISEHLNLDYIFLENELSNNNNTHFIKKTKYY
ncbi:hypothetical protein NAPIS_ORF01974 [Vairimorpha apis BRL 01]|uniref:Uncharacterized protein n=1 Tax=Vairimorpha apis BRL 01 TaxID=1037528 RepID=T0MHN0_9MICR|nr:hypothetical protein NAPIS_ORF01974 [Vairimorpha apis BRL 01]